MRISSRKVAVVAGSTLLAVALAVSAVSPSSASVAAPDPGTTDPASSRSPLAHLADEVVAAGVPGVIVETRDRRGGQTVVAGTGDLRTGEPPRPSGRFRIASITKSFTATVVLSLVAERRIRLDAPIGHYLPGMLPYDEPITVRQLLQHRSALFDYGSVLWADPVLAARSQGLDYAPADLVHIAAQEPLQGTPGRTFLYSNTDYVLLGMLVEKVTGHSYARELFRRVLHPAGLRQTYPAGHDPRLRWPSARGYEAVDSTTRLTDLTSYNMSVAWASGDLVSTTDDLNRFYAALLGGRLLPRHLLRQMLRSEPAFTGFEYGLGIGTTQICGHQVRGHVGSVPGYATYSFINPRNARQITVSANIGLTLSKPADDAIFALIGDYFCS